MSRAKKNAFLSAAETERVSAHLALRGGDSSVTLTTSRAVLFVEGETERLVLRDHSSLAASAICVLDFGTVGLAPLLRVADAMEIPWHALVDCDEAGAHYAATARDHLRRRVESRHLTIAAEPSFEQALWNAGFRASIIHVAQRHGVEFDDGDLASLLRAARLKVPKPLLVTESIKHARAIDPSHQLPRAMQTAIDAVQLLSLR